MQVKRKHGIIERINYNVEEGKSKVPEVPIEKEKAIEVVYMIPKVYNYINIQNCCRILYRLSVKGDV